MKICIIGVSDEYFRVGLEHVLKLSIEKIKPNETITIYREREPFCDVLFIDADCLSVSVAIKILKSIKPRVMVFIIANLESKFQRVNSALNNKGIYLYKGEQVNILKNIIKSKIASMLLTTKQYEVINVQSPYRELTHCQSVIINLILSGLTAKDISALLHKSEKTISSHKRSAMRRLGVTTNNELYGLRLVE